MGRKSSDLLARLAAHCPTCRLILAKVRRKLPVDNTEKQHLVQEMHFMEWADRIISERRMGVKLGGHHPSSPPSIDPADG